MNSEKLMKKKKKGTNVQNEIERQTVINLNVIRNNYKIRKRSIKPRNCILEVGMCYLKEKKK